MRGEPANAAHLLDSQTRLDASKGLDHVQDAPLLKGIHIWRFASSDRPGGWFRGSWWVGRSAYDALCALSASENTPLMAIARSRLAIADDPRAVEHINLMDVLVRASLGESLMGWSGTPKTQRGKSDNAYLGRSEPDRSITQLFIPGMSALWEKVLERPSYERIPGVVGRPKLSG